MYRPRMQRKVAARCATVAALLRFTPSPPPSLPPDVAFVLVQRRRRKQKKEGPKRNVSSFMWFW